MESKYVAVNNADYFGTHHNTVGASLTLEEAFDRWCKAAGVQKDQLPDPAVTALKFAQCNPMTVLEYPIGYLFVVKDLKDGKEKLHPANGNYATVVRWHSHSLDFEYPCGDEFLAEVVKPDGSTQSMWLSTANIGKADIPQQIFALAKSQLKETCPLKVVGCS